MLNIDIALVVRGPGSLIDWMFPRGLTLQTFVNDGLMVVFFFLIGLEINAKSSSDSSLPSGRRFCPCWRLWAVWWCLH